MKRSGLSMAAMVATVVMVLTVSTYAITARAVNPVVGLSFQGTTAVCHAKCFAGSDSDNIQATLSTHEPLPSQFLRTPKSPLRRKRRKNNFGVLTSRYVGAACCPHIVDRSVCENRPKTLLKKAVVSSLPSPLTPNRPAALQSSSKALEIRQQSVGCFRSFFTCFAHQHHPPK